MTAGRVDRNVLSSNYQEPGQTYDDKKTEGAFEVIAQQSDENWDYVAGMVAGGTLQPYPAFMSRQAIINGNFDIWQRGASFANPASGTYLADRWRNSLNANGGTAPTLTYSRVAILAEVEKSQYGMRLTANGAGTVLGPDARNALVQNIENGVRFLCGAGRKITISFFARSSIPGKKIAVAAVQTYGSGGSPSPAEFLQGKTFALTSQFQKFTLTLDTNIIGGKVFGSNNDDYLQILFFQMWGNNTDSTYKLNAGIAETFVGAGTIDFAQVQLNTGEVALPAQPRTVAEELSLCQRYYQTGFQNRAAGGFYSASAATLNIPHIVPMRSSITLIKKADLILDNAGVATLTSTGTPTILSNGDNATAISITGFAGATVNKFTSLTNDSIALEAEI